MEEAYPVRHNDSRRGAFNLEEPTFDIDAINCFALHDLLMAEGNRTHVGNRRQLEVAITRKPAVTKGDES